MGIHKGHEFRNNKRRRERERNLRRLARQGLAQRAKLINSPNLQEKVLSTKKKAKKTHKGRSGTRKGAAFRPRELWGTSDAQNEGPREAAMGRGSGDETGTSLAGQA